MSNETLNTVDYIFGWNKNNDEYIKERKNHLNTANTLIEGQLDGINKNTLYASILKEKQIVCSNLIKELEKSSKLIKTLED